MTLFCLTSCQEYGTTVEVNYGFSGSLLYSSMVTLSSALDSAASTGFTSLPAFSPTNNGGLIVGRTDSTYCRTESPRVGHPVLNSGVQFDPPQANYVFHDVYCHLRQPSNGPDRLQGAVDRVKGYLCALTDFILEDGIERSGVMSVDTTCFASNFVTMIQTQLGKSTLNVNVISYSSVPSSFGGNTSFEKALYLYLSDVNKTYKIVYTVSDTALYASVWDDGEMNFAIALEFGSSGAIRYESRSYDSDDQSVQHIRVVAQGNVSSAGSFSSVTNLQFLLHEEYGTGSGGAKFQSVSGNATDGYRTHTYYTGTGADHYVFSNYSNVNACYLGSCTGNNGIQLDDAGDIAFLSSVNASKGDYVSVDDWFAQTGPLTFNTVTTAASQ